MSEDEQHRSALAKPVKRAIAWDKLVRERVSAVGLEVCASPNGPYLRNPVTERTANLDVAVGDVGALEKLCLDKFQLRLEMEKVIELGCYGIKITLVGEGENCTGSIESDLREDVAGFVDAESAASNLQYNSMVDGVMSLVLAQAVAGIDVESPAYLEAVETALEAIGNHV